MGWRCSEKRMERGDDWQELGRGRREKDDAPKGKFEPSEGKMESMKVGEWKETERDDRPKPIMIVCTKTALISLGQAGSSSPNASSREGGSVPVRELSVLGVI